MNPLKKLAGQTALYGGSTILGRLLSYALVPLHTAVFEDTAQYGAVTEFYAYVAFLNIFYTYGMETAFFRFITRHKGDMVSMQKVYSSAVTAILSTSILFSGIIIGFSGGIADLIGYPESSQIIIWLALIMFTDAVVAVPYAKLRQENRPLMFAVTKVSSIVLTVLLNLFFLLLLPKIHTHSPILEAMYFPEMGVAYVFLANLIGNAVIPLFLWRTLSEVRLSIDWPVFRQMLIYGYPILIMGLGGMINENIDKLLLSDLLPEDFYPDMTPKEALGAYGACFKISVLMTLAVQAFRYAGEPFFFSQAENKEAPELFAKVMHYFTLLSILILLGVSVNLELIGSIFLRSPGYLDALVVVPFLLFAKLLFGIYNNLTVWFKLTDRTKYGTYFSVLGAAITLAGNFVLIPYIGYLGCAVASIACYLVMCIVCYTYGQKYYPIPYDFKPSLIYAIVALVMVYVSFQVNLNNPLLENTLNISAVLLFMAVTFLVERKRLTHRSIS
ncbi:O-antigen/teichoic acid export membrane protein [Catalinimonas alkaloidigena]|uniref:lipopolysaccharide biosynthesis protein n=1 Tax=Catalinimonas alkaloidigena TaxID=1075417 RepID=UPI0024050FD5|nr:polysaccharide biosynthesis C-terminal domain-containing protein [Catalinimonas alkaloidigena]MDF9795140.1 O-antigen/teichoic acid export membrane protein [Catalinimonas alkaloidigena]